MTDQKDTNVVVDIAATTTTTTGIDTASITTTEYYYNGVGSDDQSQEDNDGKISIVKVTGDGRSVLLELREQIKTILPTVIGFLTDKIPWVISIHMAAGLGSKELDAIALGTTISNVMGLSFSIGLSSALTTLTGQARGDLMARKGMIDRALDRDDTIAVDEEEYPLVLKGRVDEKDVTGNSRDGGNNDHDDESPVDTVSTKRSETKTRTQGTNQNSSTTAATQLQPMVYLIRGLFVQFVLLLPTGIWWVGFGTESTLVALGQGPELAAQTSYILKILFASLVGYAINWTLVSWLRAMEIADTPAYSSTAAMVLHLPCNLLFLRVFRMGQAGIAWAIVVNRWVPLLCTSFITFAVPSGRRRLLEVMEARNIGRFTLFGSWTTLWAETKTAVASCSGLFQYLWLAVPAIVVISEWWASETSIFFSGWLHPNASVALDSMTIYQGINTFFFMLPAGTSVAVSARVGRFLGAGQSSRASLASSVGVGTAAVASLVSGLFLYFLPHTLFPSFFTPDSAVIQEASKTIPLLSCYVFADGIQTALNGIIRGCGRQCVTMPIVVVAYWVVGVPLAYYLAFVRNGGALCGGVDEDGNADDSDDPFCGVVGLVTGMTVGTWVHMLLLGGVLVCTTDWEYEAQKAKHRLEKG